MAIDLQATVDAIPAVRDLNLRMDRTDDGLTFEGLIGSQHARLDGDSIVHGGIVGAILDTAATLATYVHDEQAWVTLNMELTYLRPAHVGLVRGDARIVHRGRTVALVRAELNDQTGRRCADARVLMMAPPPSKVDSS